MPIYDTVESQLQQKKMLLDPILLTVRNIIIFFLKIYVDVNCLWVFLGLEAIFHKPGAEWQCSASGLKQLYMSSQDADIESITVIEIGEYSKQTKVFEI